jgi:uncharacterized metal-binding protein YceD (DUF177 family)
MQADLPTEMTRLLPLSRLASSGLDFDVTATPAECAAIARRLQVVSLRTLDAHFLLHRLPAGTVEAQGTLKATVTQECVVTLDPFESTVAEQFVVRFVPEARFDDTEDPFLDPESIDEIPYEGDRIDLGEATIEQLALALDPFPRKPGVELPPGLGDDDIEPVPTVATVHPFATLAKKHDPN